MFRAKNKKNTWYLANVSVPTCICHSYSYGKKCTRMLESQEKYILAINSAVSLRRLHCLRACVAYAACSSSIVVRVGSWPREVVKNFVLRPYGPTRRSNASLLGRGGV